MNEGPRQAPKAAAIDQPAEPVMLGAEGWQERPLIPTQREYFQFQFELAQEVARRTGLPFIDAVQMYAPVLYAHAMIYNGNTELMEPPMGLTEDNMVDIAYQDEVRRDGHLGPVAYKRGVRRGCFMYTMDKDKEGRERPIANIHFVNAEYDATGPLSREKMEQRIKEVGDVMRAIRADHPETQEVHGDSWLYNLEAYRRLFPDTYTADLAVDESPKAWSRGTTIMGQFLDSDCGLKEDLAKAFMDKVRQLPEHVPMDDLPKLLLEALPMKPLRAKAPIADFYAHYVI